MKQLELLFKREYVRFEDLQVGDIIWYCGIWKRTVVVLREEDAYLLYEETNRQVRATEDFINNNSCKDNYPPYEWSER